VIAEVLFMVVMVEVVEPPIPGPDGVSDAA
jgi:hypothetical protein